ncbi:hypothetical protein [Teredinibacter franksiae]|uniref:hypothetical protein n=1 Tax=Teredinibacter franksiae TaxID=2761453 RepID=UPI0016292B63|nr:hypothetical protein [Teredinibacter franksiae]
MIESFSKLKDKPLLLSGLGWLLFPGMYLLVGVFTALGASVETSFLIAAPAGVLGFVFWVAALTFGASGLLKSNNIAASLGGLVASIVPLAFLGFAFWVALNGGV